MTLPQQIAAYLTRKIMNGEIAPTTRLPTERELAAEYGTTRNVIREAIKRLEAVGLVQSRQGSGTYAQNPQLSAGVELFDSLMLLDDGTVNLKLLRDALEFRTYVIRFIVRMAALRRTADELTEVERLVAVRRGARDLPDLLEETTARLFHVIAYATHNQICHLMFNTVEKVSFKVRSYVDTYIPGFESTQEVFERLVDAFQRRDPAQAELTILRYGESLEDIFREAGAPHDPIIVVRS